MNSPVIDCYFVMRSETILYFLQFQNGESIAIPPNEGAQTEKKNNALFANSKELLLLLYAACWLLVVRFLVYKPNDMFQLAILFVFIYLVCFFCGFCCYSFGTTFLILPDEYLMTEFLLLLLLFIFIRLFRRILVLCEFVLL